MTCRCGHPKDAHEHYRGGRECAHCPEHACPRHRPDIRRAAADALFAGRAVLDLWRQLARR